MDDLVWKLNNDGYYTVGYAILNNGKFLHSVSEVSQESLHTVKQWCDRTNLPINPNKMVTIPFTRKRNIMGLKKPNLFNKTIQLTSAVKYLGLRLDKGLTWKKELHNVINKTYRAL